MKKPRFTGFIAKTAVSGIAMSAVFFAGCDSPVSGITQEATTSYSDIAEETPIYSETQPIAVKLRPYEPDYLSVADCYFDVIDLSPLNFSPEQEDAFKRAFFVWYITMCETDGAFAGMELGSYSYDGVTNIGHYRPSGVDFGSFRNWISAVGKPFEGIINPDELTQDMKADDPVYWYVNKDGELYFVSKTVSTDPYFRGIMFRPDPNPIPEGRERLFFSATAVYEYENPEDWRIPSGKFYERELKFQMVKADTGWQTERFDCWLDWWGTQG